MSERQLDLFSSGGNRSGPGPSDSSSAPTIAWEAADDERIAAALPGTGLAESLTLAAQAGRRRLAAAIPGLDALCRRFAGFGTTKIVPEQAAALEALVAIGGSESARAVGRLIAKHVVQGPVLPLAVHAAATLGAPLPGATVDGFLRHHDPAIRADACRCARAAPDTIALLTDLLDDLHPQVSAEAACALGRMGRTRARPLLIALLRRAPSPEVIDAIAGVADEDCLVLLGRVAREEASLAASVLEALDSVDTPRAATIAAAIRRDVGPP